MWPQSTTADHKCWAQTQAAPDKREKVKKHRVDNKIHVELRYSRHAVYVMRINTPTVMYLREKILFGVNKRCFFLWHVYVCAAAVFVSSWASLFLFSDGEERTRMAALRRAPIRSSRFYSSISFCSINNDGTTIRRFEMDIIMSSTYVSWCCLTLKSSALPGGILDKLSFRQVALRSFIREKNTVVTHLWKEHCGHSSVKRTLWSLICEGTLLRVVSASGRTQSMRMQQNCRIPQMPVRFCRINFQIKAWNRLYVYETHAACVLNSENRSRIHGFLTHRNNYKNKNKTKNL